MGLRLTVAALVLSCLFTAAPPAAASPDAAALPEVTPRPQQLTANGGPLTVPSRVRVLTAGQPDRPTRDLVVSVLRAAGATSVEESPLPATGVEADGLTVVVGVIGDVRVADALRAAGGQVPASLPAEGYALASRAAPGGGTVVLAGADASGTYYAAQTLRQLTVGTTVFGVSVVDHPLMPLRGAIEGFYGSPWTHAERLDQLAFYGALKMNTYLYAPKDDPYHRERWREPYPTQLLAQLGELIRQAADHHVRFTFALSPGVSICYSSAADRAALEAKLQAVYDLGVRSFSIPLDDISYTRWNCAGDRTAYGAPSQQSAARAQVDLLNRLQRGFLATRPGTQPLQMVPTEYGDVTETPYKKTIREQLDPRVEVMWTGTDTVPPRITVQDASRAASVWGRKVFLWDNYPVNDYGQAEGRLLLAPYAAREPGLHTQLSGLVLNPMNQAAASKVALFGGADFAWNDTGYDPQRAWRAAAAHLADGDPSTVEALLAFFDVEHLAPTFGSTPWQPQAPQLAARLGEFRSTWATGAKDSALRALRPHAQLLTSAPARIRTGVTDKGFVADCAPWLDALHLWGTAFERTLDALAARITGDETSAQRLFTEASTLTSRAGAIQTIPGETRPQGPVRVADGVLDVFLTEARTLR
ncbi:beta-N-acetylglucosaminidase domain-containing protein [Streptomyces roseirectus]|uniref:Beta-N-acetylglucosaminidase domain-containing protein n=1 Tax=Streptomyces roseirectus TaxID=2768066 RepID=A0A7H0I7Q0_9ACTN|nr:beta-N-acetylglucosaminidase domain-containing protein [Streptomyces roseirectus]QNP68816.1 beta-N-acetylglucosaminidase domain-containing protein [Streptomyces roseirectus]